MADYISRERLIEKLNDSEVPENERIDIGYNEALKDVIQYLTEMPAADVQLTEKIKEYQSLLEECERKLSYLFECEIESTWESQKVKELIAKIHSCIQNNYEGG